MNRSILFPTALGVICLGVCVYEGVEISRLRAQVAALSARPDKGADSAKDLEGRVSALERRASTLAAPARGPVRAPENNDPEPAEPADLDQPAADAPAPGVQSALSPEDRAAAQEIGSKLMAAMRSESLDLAENRKAWIAALAAEGGLSSTESARLGAVMEDEFQRRAKVIADVKSGAKGRKEGRNELAKLEVSANDQARSILGPDHYEKYFARRVASGIHDKGATD